MLDTLNAGRAARGLPPLDVQLAHLDGACPALPYEDLDLPETWGDVA
jgi:hypothetical protein